MVPPMIDITVINPEYDPESSLAVRLGRALSLKLQSALRIFLVCLSGCPRPGVKSEWPLYIRISPDNPHKGGCKNGISKTKTKTEKDHAYPLVAQLQF